MVAFLRAGPEEEAVVEGDWGAVFCVWAAVFAFTYLGERWLVLDV